MRRVVDSSLAPPPPVWGVGSAGSAGPHHHAMIAGSHSQLIEKSAIWPFLTSVTVSLVQQVWIVVGHRAGQLLAAAANQIKEAAGERHHNRAVRPRLDDAQAGCDYSGFSGQGPDLAKTPARQPLEVPSSGEITAARAERHRPLASGEQQAQGRRPGGTRATRFARSRQRRHRPLRTPRHSSDATGHQGRLPRSSRFVACEAWTSLPKSPTPRGRPANTEKPPTAISGRPSKTG